MKIQQRGGVRLLSWTGGALLLAFLVGVPRDAGARYYQPQDPPFPEGDPEADDQPSPTPKLSRNKATAMARVDSGDTGLSNVSKSRLIWLAYVRAWIRITVR